MAALYTTTEHGGRIYNNEIADQLWLRGNADEIIEAFETGDINEEEYLSMLDSEEIKKNNFKF